VALLVVPVQLLLLLLLQLPANAHLVLQQLGGLAVA
jgi:hypothetical protein